MAIPSELQPLTKRRVIDLASEAGIDVSNWANYERGVTNPGANPKYCYEWAIDEPGKLVVCNLWYRNMVERNGEIEQHLSLSSPEANLTRRARRDRMKLLLSTAFREHLPLRVIVLDGVMRMEAGEEKARVRTRKLDPVPWAVISMDEVSGDVVVRRGAKPQKFTDQFSLNIEPLDESSIARYASVQVRTRSPQVRAAVLVRANGFCEFCGTPGFNMSDGSLFLETHHTIPLSEGGPDTVANVVALCPNHHREAHYGRNRDAIRHSLQEGRRA